VPECRHRRLRSFESRLQKRTFAPTREVGAPQTSKRGEWATVRLLLPPSGYAPEQKSGPQEVGLTAEGDNDALAGPFLVECPPCASTYSPGAPQSNGSPACAVVSRLMSTHARVGEAIRRHRAHCTALHDSESSTDPRARPGHPKA